MSSKPLQPFARSAQYYDQIYSGGRKRNYSREVDVIASFFGELQTNGRQIVDWGCGTGEHLSRWPAAAPGWQASGFDPSDGMVQICQRKGLDVYHGDICSTLPCHGLAPAAVQTCLFGAFGYAAAGPDSRGMNAALDNVKWWAASGGLFILDVVNYLAAACHLRSQDCYQCPELRRTFRKRFDLEESLLHYEIEYEPANAASFVESHVMRAFTPRELRQALRLNGFDVLHCFDPESAQMSKPGPESFYFMLVARKR
jgi:hypothetical protein